MSKIYKGDWLTQVILTILGKIFYRKVKNNNTMPKTGSL